MLRQSKNSEVSMQVQRRETAPKSYLGRSSALRLIVFTTVFSLLYFYSAWKTVPPFEMAPLEFPPNAEIPLQVTISDAKTVSVDSQLPVVSLKITVHNTSPDKTVSFLRWSSPLDLQASPMGIFVFTNLSNGQNAPCVSIKLNRKIPETGVFSNEDTIRIEAGGKVEKDVEVKAPDVRLTKGEKYSVQAKGHWMHVQVSEDTELKTNDGDVLRGGFASEAVELEVPA